MIDNEQPMNEQESLALITSMINKAKGQFHESGTSAIIWGSVIGLAGLISFIQRYFNFYIGFDIWWLVLLAFIPQIIISIKESRRRKVVGHDTTMLDAIWTVYGISIFALLFYSIIVPGVADGLYTSEGKALFIKTQPNGSLAPFNIIIPSQSSLYLILYAIPTLATGIGRGFRPMLIGGIICYIFFILSCYTSVTWDSLWMSIAAICNWLIPGIILRKRYLKGLVC